ncbi:MAG: hypothetical protein ACKVT1_15975 [Dehalococcoidia bacterium]
MAFTPISAGFINAIAAAFAGDNLAGVRAPAPEPTPNQPQPTPPQIRATPSTNDSRFSPVPPAPPPLRATHGCVAFRRDGQPCAGRPRTGAALCPYHDPCNAAALREAGRKGGKASAAQRRAERARPPGPIEFDHIYTCDRDGIQRMLDALFRLELSGMLPAARTRNLIRLLETSIRNVAAGSSGVNAPGIGDLLRSLDNEVLRAVTRGAPDGEAAGIERH